MGAALCGKTLNPVEGRATRRHDDGEEDETGSGAH
jgi:hypothetical protein